MKLEDQIDEWVKGNPIHDKEHNVCCPDFSCCTGEIAPLEVRKRFAKAFYEDDFETISQMMIIFIQQTFAKINIYIPEDAPTLKTIN